MKIAIFLAAVTIGLSFAVGGMAARYGSKVADRFLERGSYSEENLEKFVENLKNFVQKQTTEARGYVFPVLFPGDLLFMIFLGGFLAVASVELAQSIDGLKKVAWLFAIGPALYVAVDLVEDVLLARMLLSAEAINANAVALAQMVTKAKIVTCGYAILQTIAISGAAALGR